MTQKRKCRRVGEPTDENNPTIDEDSEALLRKAKKISDEVKEFEEIFQGPPQQGKEIDPPCPICGEIGCPSWGIP